PDAPPLEIVQPRKALLGRRVGRVGLGLGVHLLGVPADQHQVLHRRSSRRSVSRLISMDDGWCGPKSTLACAASHAAQSMHSSGSMTRIRSASWMQSTGHTSTHERSLRSMHGAAMMYVTANSVETRGRGASAPRPPARPATRPV